jgi:hypothetical protein
MRCEEIRTLVGAYHDGEAPPAARAALEAHVAWCPACAAALAAVAELRELARALPEPEPPGDLWARIVPRLDAEPAWKFRALLRHRGRAAAAALLLAALAAGWWAWRSTAREQPAPAASSVDLSPYLDYPEAAVAGEGMSPAEAGRMVDFRVLSTSDLPAGYCLQRCCLCRDGRCDRVACAYCRGGERLLVIQCAPGQSVAFGDRPVLCTHMNGKPTRVVQGEGCLAASWQVNGTAVSLIGPRDMAELVRLMAHVDGHLSGRP